MGCRSGYGVEVAHPYFVYMLGVTYTAYGSKEVSAWLRRRVFMTNSICRSLLQQFETTTVIALRVDSLISPIWHRITVNESHASSVIFPV